MAPAQRPERVPTFDCCIAASAMLSTSDIKGRLDTPRIPTPSRCAVQLEQDLTNSHADEHECHLGSAPCERAQIARELEHAEFHADRREC